MATIIMLLAFIGFFISLYSFYLEKVLKRGIVTEKPFCDISDTVSCSKPLLSRYNTIFFAPNSILGMLFYTLVFICAWYEANFLVFLLSAAGLIATLILAYVLFFKIRSLCILCLSIYIVNIVLFMISFAAL